MPMNTAPRKTSSVYSDTDVFHLEDVLHRLSKRDSAQGAVAMQDLIEENKALKQEVARVRRLWTYVYKIMTEVNDAYFYFSRILQEGDWRMEKERQKWLANCTAI